MALHSVKKHLRRCAPQLHSVFPAGTEEEKQLLTLLENAYLGSRYELSFTIPDAQMDLLFSRVKQLVETAALVVDSTVKKLQEWY